MAGRPPEASPPARWRRSPSAWRRRASPGRPTEEAQRLWEAIAGALAQLAELQALAEGDGADILAFQAAMLEDPELSDPAFAALSEGALGRRGLERGAGGANPRIRNGRRRAFPGARDRYRRYPRPRAGGVARGARRSRASPRARSCLRTTFRRRGFFQPIGAAAAPSRSPEEAPLAMSRRLRARAACR